MDSLPIIAILLLLWLVGTSPLVMLSTEPPNRRRQTSFAIGAGALLLTAAVLVLWI